jgi:hypothetical protein
MYWKKNHDSDEEFETKLREKYSNKIQTNKDKKQDMVKFFKAMQDPNTNPEQEAKMMQVLHGGKGEMKRHYAIDANLYGTQEGVQKRKEATGGAGGGGGEVTGVDVDVDVDAKKKKKLRKKKLKKMKQQPKQTENNNDTNDTNKNNGNTAKSTERVVAAGNYRSMNLPTTQQTAVGTVALGALGLIAALISGKKSS